MQEIDETFADQNRVIDSLLVDSLKTLIGKESVDIQESKEALLYVESRLEEVENKVFQIDLLDQIAMSYLKLEDTLEFHRTNKKLLLYEPYPEAAKAVAWHHYNAVDIFKKQGQLAEAYSYLKEGYDRLQDVDLVEEDEIYKVRMLYQLANIEEEARLYEKAESTLIQCLRLLDQNEYDEEKKNGLYASINAKRGSVHLGMKNYDQSRLYYEKAAEYGRLLKSVKDREKRENLHLSSLAASYILEKDYDKAFLYYSKMYQKIDGYNSNRALINAYSGYAMSGFLADQISAKNAEDKLNQAQQIAIDNLPRQLPWVNYCWAHVLQAKGRKTQSVKKMEKAYLLAQQYENRDREIESLRFLAVNARRNNAKYSKAYAYLVEKTWQEERELQGRFAEVEYETEKAKAETAAEREKLSEQLRITEKEEQMKQIYLGLSVALLLLSFGGYVIIEQRGKNKELLWEKQQQAANEEIYDLMLSQRAKMEEGKQLAEKNISEEIHDGILGEMLGIRLILSGLNENSDEASVEKRQELIEQLQGLEEELRSISHQLSDSAYKKVNEFVLALEELLDTNCKPAELTYHFSHSPDFNWDHLPGEVKIQLYRMLQGGLKNTIKHAEATEVEAVLLASEREISLKLRDNGVGFDQNQESKGIGLKNLKSRIQKIKGNLDIQSVRGKGTTLCFSIPMNQIYTDMATRRPSSESTLS